MIPERYLDLMHGEIDAVNTPAASEELRAYLEAHPEAHAFYRELRVAAEALSGVPEEDPPPELRARIMAAVGSARERAAAPRPRRRGLADFFFPATGPPRLAVRYAACGAAGLALGLVLALALSRSVSTRAPGDMAPLYGALHGQWPPGTTGPAADLAADGVSGTARGARLGEEWIVVQIDLDVPRAVPGLRVEIAHPSSVAYAGVWGLRGAPASLVADGGHVEFDHNGLARYLVLFRAAERGEPSFHIALRSADKVLVERRLASPRS